MASAVAEKRLEYTLEELLYLRDSPLSAQLPEGFDPNRVSQLQRIGEAARASSGGLPVRSGLSGGVSVPRSASTGTNVSNISWIPGAPLPSSSITPASGTGGRGGRGGGRGASASGGGSSTSLAGDKWNDRKRGGGTDRTSQGRGRGGEGRDGRGNDRHQSHSQSRGRDEEEEEELPEWALDDDTDPLATIELHGIPGHHQDLVEEEKTKEDKKALTSLLAGLGVSAPPTAPAPAKKSLAPPPGFGQKPSQAPPSATDGQPAQTSRFVKFFNNDEEAAASSASSEKEPAAPARGSHFMKFFGSDGGETGAPQPAPQQPQAVAQPQDAPAPSEERFLLQSLLGKAGLAIPMQQNPVPTPSQPASVAHHAAAAPPLSPKQAKAPSVSASSPMVVSAPTHADGDDLETSRSSLMKFFNLGNAGPSNDSSTAAPAPVASAAPSTSAAPPPSAPVVQPQQQQPAQQSSNNDATPKKSMPKNAFMPTSVMRNVGYTKKKDVQPTSPSPSPAPAQAQAQPPAASEAPKQQPPQQPQQPQQPAQQPAQQPQVAAARPSGPPQQYLAQAPVQQHQHQQPPQQSRPSAPLQTAFPQQPLQQFQQQPPQMPQQALPPQMSNPQHPLQSQPPHMPLQMPQQGNLPMFMGMPPPGMGPRPMMGAPPGVFPPQHHNPAMMMGPMGVGHPQQPQMQMPPPQGLGFAPSFGGNLHAGQMNMMRFFGDMGSMNMMQPKQVPQDAQVLHAHNLERR